MVKKFISIIITLSMLLSLCVIGISAAEEPVLTVTNTEASRGQTVTVDVIVSGNPGMDAASLKPVYDKTSLELVSMQYNNALFPGESDYGIKAVWSAYSDIIANGIFLTLTFKVRDGAKTGKALVTIENKDGYLNADAVCNRAEETIPYKVIDGGINIVERDALTLSVPTVYAERGRQITFDVQIFNNPGICAAVIKPVYDETVLELISMQVNLELFPGMVIYHEKVVWAADRNDWKSNGTFLSLTFKVLDDAKLGQSDVTVECSNGDICNTDEQSVLFNILGGSVNVTDDSLNGFIVSAKPGVIDENCEISILPVNKNDVYIPNLAGYNMLAAVIYEVNLKKDGVKVSPNGEITVSAPVPSSLDERKCTVLCFDANGNITDLNAVYKYYGTISFTTDIVNYYIVAEKYSVLYDLNGDEQLNAKDIVRLMKIIAGVPEINAYQSTDINGDGTTNAKDIVRLMKFIAFAS